MKKLLLFAFALFVSVPSAKSEIFNPFGQNYVGGTPVESVVTVSSYAYSTSAAVASGNYREFMNTGTVDIKRYTVLASSTTAGMTFIAPGAIWVEDRYMGDYYFSTPTGQSTSTLSIKTFKNR